MQPHVLIDRWVKVLFLCITVSSLSFATTFAVYITTQVFPAASSFLGAVIVGGLTLTVSLSLLTYIYFIRVEKNLNEKTLLLQRTNRVGLKLIKVGLSLGSLSILPLAYLFFRPLLISSYIVNQIIFTFYLIYFTFPFDAYISCLLFTICVSSAFYLLTSGLILYKKGKI